MRRVIAYVSGNEGRADSLNRNRDGAGLSFGILQWNQRAGSLGPLLAAMRTADPAAWDRIFGPSGATLLAATARGGTAPVDGHALWEEPWASRFVAAGRHPAFVDVQWRHAESGEHFRGALDVARILGVRTERALVLFFDRSVQQGPAAARRLAETVRAGAPDLSGPELLRTWAERAAASFRRSTAPDGLQFSTTAKHIGWKPVGDEWHAFAGKWDLYADIARRTQRILSDPGLSDVPLP